MAKQSANHCGNILHVTDGCDQKTCSLKTYPFTKSLILSYHLLQPTQKPCNQQFLNALNRITMYGFFQTDAYLLSLKNVSGSVFAALLRLNLVQTTYTVERF